MKKSLACGLMTVAAILCLGSSVPAADSAPEIPGLVLEAETPLQYAEQFSIYQYEEGYSLLDVKESGQYLLIPEGGEVPESLDSSIKVLYKPLDTIYLAATSAMSLFDSADALDQITLSGTSESGWTIPNAAKAMEEGRMQFAGKYSEPDYELLIGSGCDLAIESTMILHSPKVQEMLEGMGIPVFIDRSSYESHPLGRTEWIKLYGEMTDHQDKAAAFFDEQTKVLTDLKDFANTEKSVVFFYLSTDGKVVVRASSDYLPKMIELAGGRYLFDELTDPNSNRSSVSLTMEEFYATAVDADYLIYNASIDEPIQSVAELTAKSALFADFRAVKEGNVWCADKRFYQATDTIGEMIRDLNGMLTGASDESMTFLTKVE